MPVSVSHACFQGSGVSSLGPFSQEQTSTAMSIPLALLSVGWVSTWKDLEGAFRVSTYTRTKPLTMQVELGWEKYGGQAKGWGPRAHSPHPKFLKEVLGIQELKFIQLFGKALFVKVGRLKIFNSSLALFVTLTCVDT